MSSEAATTPRTAAPGRDHTIVGLDGPRGLSCLCIMTLHVAATWNPTLTEALHLGLLGTSVFFFLALSGFLLYLPYARSLVDGAALPGTARYARHRLLRVFPAYLVIFLLADLALRAVYVRNAVLVGRPFSDIGTGLLHDPGTLLANLTLTQSLLPATLQTGIGPSWSLTTELCFYACLPVLGVVVARWSRRSPGLRPALVPVLVLVVIGLAGKVLARLLVPAAGEDDRLLQEWGPNWVAVVSRSFLALADVFACGMLVAVLVVALQRGLLPERVVRRIRPAAACALLPVSVAVVALVAGELRLQSTAAGVLSGLLIALVVVPVGPGRVPRLARLADWRPLRWVGLVSLSAYLWHYPVLVVVGRAGWLLRDSAVGLVANVLVVWTVTLLLASVTYYAVERPAMALARRQRRSPVAARW